MLRYHGSCQSSGSPLLVMFSICSIYVPMSTGIFSFALALKNLEALGDSHGRLRSVRLAAARPLSQPSTDPPFRSDRPPPKSIF
ncbi:hypothetical protein TAL182_CH01766 [Rhizobium sp. TAL182]|nr:hypothetical protein TAL182_CH01766 [Rhizobium sp. TAL182]